MANSENVNFTRDIITNYTVFVDEKELIHYFGEQAGHIIKLMKESNPSNMQKQLELKGAIKVDGFNVLNGVKVNEEAREYIGMWTQHAKVYIKKELSNELYLKGLLREIMRRIQDLRKRNGLVESDRIELMIFAEGRLKKAITELGHKDQLKMKTGADKITFLAAKDIKEG
ncbi:hypothetical protein J7K43_08590 [Candidatus Calescamantes bacterium]|nr:hypothetical protein [Candidatus Calescamantes bacterium]